MKFKKVIILYSLIIFSFCFSACQPIADQILVDSETGVPMKTMDSVKTITGKFTPPDGQTLFIIGEDNDTISDYLKAIPDPIPGGVTSYTSLQRLEGLDSPADYGAGLVYLDDLVKFQPQGVIALGLYMVNYLDATVAGDADAHIDHLLSLLGSYDRPVYLRFGYEFDGTWNHYDPELYKQAWIYFRTKMQEKGVTNIAMVWQSATYSEGTYLQKSIEDWYPGDEFVDWIGLSYFTQGSSTNTTPLSDLLAFARMHNKPVMIAEAAPQRYATGKLTYCTTGQTYVARSAEAIWQEWYAPFFEFIDQNQDVIRAVAYINTNWDSQTMWGPPYDNGYWGDSRVQANDLIKQRWLEEINKDSWLNASPDLFNILGYPK